MCTAKWSLRWQRRRGKAGIVTVHQVEIGRQSIFSADICAGNADLETQESDRVRAADLSEKVRTVMVLAFCCPVTVQ